MSAQVKSYIKDMQNMYEVLIKKTELSPIEVMFLELYKRTLL